MSQAAGLGSNLRSVQGLKTVHKRSWSCFNKKMAHPAAKWTHIPLSMYSLCPNVCLRVAVSADAVPTERRQNKVRKDCFCVCCGCCYWHGPTWHVSGANVSHLAMSYHYLCLLLSDESALAPCWGAGLYLMGSFSRGLLGGSLLQTHLKKGLWISWLPGRSLLLSIRWSPRLYPSVNGPGEQWMQQFLIPEMPLSTVCLAVLW